MTARNKAREYVELMKPMAEVSGVFCEAWREAEARIAELEEKQEATYYPRTLAWQVTTGPI